MNVSVAAIDRGDNRATPHTPWPLVQPLAKRVPKPTSSPASASWPPQAEIATGIASPLTRRASRQPPIKPAMKSARQSLPVTGTSRPATIPLIPAMRPVVSSSRLAEIPMSVPPIVAV